MFKGGRGWVRLHEKGGKEHELPCHHNLEEYPDAHIAAAGIAGDLDGPLFRTTPASSIPCGGRAASVTRIPAA